MGHPLIEEFCRANNFQPSFLRRCQRVFREEVQPLLDQRDVLAEENDALKAVVEKLKAAKAKKDAAA